MENAIDIANFNQKAASDPLASVFVSASAGSGKTKLLVDRLLRLMLPVEIMQETGETLLVAGTDPSRILCLTYTNAAAAEMANRLQKRLAEWVSLSDEDLAKELEALDVPNYEETRKQARGLFLRVLDLPAGLRIETIHAFCQSLLRRFPLEAIIDPHFKLIEDEENMLVLSRAVEKILAETPEYAQSLSIQTNLNDMLDNILKGLTRKIHDFSYIFEAWKQDSNLIKEIYANILKTTYQDEEDVRRISVKVPDEAGMKEEFQAALAGADPKKPKQAEKLYDYLNWLALPHAERKISDWYDLLFTKDHKIRSFSKVILKKMQEYAPDLIERLEGEAVRQKGLKEELKAFYLRALNIELMRFTLPVLSHYKKEKSLRAVVDYQDLIIYTRALLRDPGASWVLYKLDGGIDHLLLDEVQDTSLEQWKIAAALTEDFFSGSGGREESPRPRTIFAVGDFKQSIFGFQGAEPEQFLRWRKNFAHRVRKAGLLWKEPELHVSFRSVPGILRFVDEVFSSEISSKGVHDKHDKKGKERLKHISAREGEGGLVEIWPLIAKESKEESSSPWKVPDKNRHVPTAEQKLVDHLITWLKDKIGKPLQEGAEPLQYGDILFLLRKRSSFASLLIRALKSNHIPVTNFLGTKLTDHLVVKDLMALCATLLLPQDNLNLATILTSPIGNISDDSLMDLMTNNRQERMLGKGTSSHYGSLWEILRARHGEREEWRRIWQCLSMLYRRVDYDTPYRILVQALGVWGMRASFLQRLGPEASEPIDELLAEALNYEKEHSPSLQGFLHWLERTEKRSKREAENTGNIIRIMTVHAAKGLQARLVIVPDVYSQNHEKETILWKDIDQRSAYESSQLPLWIPKKDFRTEQIKTDASEIENKQLEEENRLLYVALTRASDYLLLCGTETSQKNNDYRWYAQVKAAIERLNHQKIPSFFDEESPSLIYQEEVNYVRKRQEIHESLENEEMALPAWMGRAPHWEAIAAPLEETLTRPLAPSRPDGAEFGALPLARSPLERLKGKKEGIIGKREFAMLRGKLVHSLLQFLPHIKPQERYKSAYSFLSKESWGLEDVLIKRLIEQIFNILEDERLQPLFGPNSVAEQAISGTIMTQDGGRVVLGKVDRFAIEKETLLLCDYKTDRKPPKDISKISTTYLRQMAAYYGVMRNIYPDHKVQSFFVWTEGPEITYISEEILKENL